MSHTATLLVSKLKTAVNYMKGGKYVYVFVLDVTLK